MAYRPQNTPLSWNVSNKHTNKWTSLFNRFGIEPAEITIFHVHGANDLWHVFKLTGAINQKGSVRSSSLWYNLCSKFVWSSGWFYIFFTKNKHTTKKITPMCLYSGEEEKPIIILLKELQKQMVSNQLFTLYMSSDSSSFNKYRRFNNT